MYQVMIFLHVISALLLGAYVAFPFHRGTSCRFIGAAQESFVGLLSTLNRIAQFSLIVTFLTGGAMISQVDPKPSALWMALSSLFCWLSLEPSQA